MERKKPTDSKSTSASFDEVFNDPKDRWRSNEARPDNPGQARSGHTLLESEMPLMSDNDVWYYQLQLEKFVRDNAPGMDGRFQGMLAAICAQARRANKRDGT